MAESFQNFLSRGDRSAVALALSAGLAFVATILGATLALLGPVYAIALLITLIASLWILTGLENALWSVIGVITLLPFATLPFKVVLTPTFLNLALGAAIFLYLMQWMTGERRRLTVTPVHPLLTMFAILCIFSFVAGLRYAGLTSTAIRRFAELLLAIGFAGVLVDVLCSPTLIRRFVKVMILGGTAAAAIGICLWLLPDQVTEGLLIRLGVIGYPTADVVRYIDQNPELAERAIGTSVNPNALGGLLVMIASLIAPQALDRECPLFRPVWLPAVMLAVVTGCLVLTFSRGSMISFGVALTLIAVIRYPKLIVYLAIAGLVFALLPWSQSYIERFVEGFQGADLATQMRFGEYKDALILIGRYPLLGVGFTGTPDIDIYLGVASVYFTIAQNMGLLGLSAFLLLMIRVFGYSWQTRNKLRADTSLYPIWLGTLAAMAGVLVNGIFDHYFFNLEFSFAVTIFWTFVGLLLAISKTARSRHEDQTIWPA